MTNNNNNNNNNIYTPLLSSRHYPITKIQQLFPYLVYRRVQSIYTILYDLSSFYFSKYNVPIVDKPRLYLLGSQVHGQSKSPRGQQADIDLFLVWKTLAQMSPCIWQAFIRQVKKQAGFRVDIGLQITSARFGPEVLFVPYEEKNGSTQETTLSSG